MGSIFSSCADQSFLRFKEYQHLKNELEEEKSRCKQLQNQLKYFNSKYENPNNNNHRDIVDRINKENDNLKIENQSLKKELNQLGHNEQTNNRVLNSLRDDYNRQIAIQQQKYKQLNEDYVASKERIIRLESLVKQKQQQQEYEKRELKVKVTKLEKQNKQIQQKSDQQISRLNNQINKRQQAGEVNEDDYVPDRNYSRYFQGDVLYQTDDYRDYLVNALENTIHRPIQSTRLIYKYDPSNQNSLHKYIDNIENLVLLVRGVNGYIFGAWTEGGFIPKMPSNKSGMLFSITNRTCFKLLNPTSKAIIYDDYYVIFGNNELRVKNKENTAKSNFGKINGFYQSNGEQANYLLGNGDKDKVEIASFEFFQLVFKR